MRQTRRAFLSLVLFLGFANGIFSVAATAASQTDRLILNARNRVASGETWHTVEKRLEWDPRKTAIVVCDMWDQHWCQGATARVAEMAPRMNQVIREARRRGVFIIHAPSDTMEFYKDTPQRKRAQAAPKAIAAVPLKRWCSLDPTREAPLPIDDGDGGCDDRPQCAQRKAWSRQIPVIEIADGDAVTDSDEAYNLLQQRGIENVIVMGVHVNMCVLGRPFSIRQMVYQGKNVLLMRDLTDAMYNSRRPPYVSHFRGTGLVIEHIEKYWCPSITSADILGGEPFRFAADKRPHVVFVIGENEYRTAETLPEFARQELEFRGFKCSYVQAPSKGGNTFENIGAIAKADVLVISVRRRTPPLAMLELLRAHVRAGKPVVGIRTASHAFDAKAPDGHGAWPEFDREILGGDYRGHYNNKPGGPATIVQASAEASGHPVLIGIPLEPFKVVSHLYKNPSPAPQITPLMIGYVEGRDERHPVAWVNTANGRRVFYTSLGHPDEFDMPAFRRLLLNGILWALDYEIPPAEAKLRTDRSAVGSRVHSIAFN